MNYREWVWKNRRKFLEDDYTVPEMIELSLAVNSEHVNKWSLLEIRQTLRNWPRALWTPRDPDESANNISKQKIDHFEDTVKGMRCSSLQDQWHNVMNHQNGLE